MLNAFSRSIHNHPGIVITIFLIIALLIWGVWPTAIKVESLAVQKAPLTVSIEKNGRTRIIDRYVMAAPVNGMTCQMHLNVGDPVTQGQTLLSITPLKAPILNTQNYTQAEANVSATKAALNMTKEQVRATNATLRLAREEAKRYQTLLKKGLVSQDIYDKANTALATAIANKGSANFKVDVAKYELKSALTALKHTQNGNNNQILPASSHSKKSEQVLIQSPIKGQILKVVRQCDRPVMLGEALLEIGDPNALEVEVDVLSADAVKIHSGMKVLFERWGGDPVLEGVVRLVEPIGFTKVSALGVEEQRVWVIANFTSPIEQWQSLGDGYRVEAKFILWHEESVLQVPSSSLFRYQTNQDKRSKTVEHWGVFIIQNGKAKRQTVTIGQRNGLNTQILSGLTEGQMIINHPNELIEESMRVEERGL